MPRVSAAYLADRRRHILGAALRCFAREGFHQTTMRHVVREAGLSAGALYQYFASKEDIVAAIAAEHRAADRRLLRDALADGDPAGGLRRLTRALARRLEDEDERRWRRVTVQVWGEALRNPRVKRVVLAGLEQPLGALASAVRRRQREGRAAADLDAQAVARVAIAIFQGLVLQQAWDPKLDVAACLRAADALLAGLSGRRPRSRTKRTAARARR